MVYVLDIEGRPLMPTERHGKVRRLLRDGLAHIVRLQPFTIRLDYESTTYKQEVSLGIDAGSKHIGISATTEKKELLSAEVLLRTDVVKKLASRLELRRSRRHRKTRYRKPRFNNRRRAEDWLPPSIRSKAESHLKVIRTVHSLLPVSKTTIEVAQFDQQKMENDLIQGVEYQQGEQMGFWNVREYVLARDGHKCQYCKGKSGDKVLNVHHLESRKTGGNAPGNLITLCETCHKAYHRGEFELKIKRNTSLRGIENGIEKTHCADAFCISRNLKAIRSESYLLCRCLPRHTRSLHVCNPKKGGIRRGAVASHWIGNSRLQRFDSVEWNGLRCFIFGSTNGRPILRDIDGNTIASTPAVNAKTVKFKSRKRNNMLIAVKPQE